MIVHVTFSERHDKSLSCDVMREEGKGHSYLPQTSIPSLHSGCSIIAHSAAAKGIKLLVHSEAHPPP